MEIEKNKVYNLINEYVQGMKEIDEHFESAGRVDAQEKEQAHYKTKFRVLGIDGRITNNLYSFRNNEEGIQKIKENVENYLD